MKLKMAMLLLLMQMMSSFGEWSNDPILCRAECLNEGEVRRLVCRGGCLLGASLPGVNCEATCDAVYRSGVERCAQDNCSEIPWEL